MYRNTYLEINLNNIKHNVRTIINKYNNYKYYIGVVKADCYGHGIVEPVKAIIDGGCNYLAVATLDEALEIRKQIKNIPILCLGIIPIEYIHECIKKDIAITISNLAYLEDLIKLNCNLKVHLKINTGMNRLGVDTKKEFNDIYNKIISSNLYLEGIYTHIYDAKNIKKTKLQFEKFEDITSDIDLNSVDIIHAGASDTIVGYEKKEYINGCRLGIIIYGLIENNDLGLLDTFKLVSEVIQINSVSSGTVGYDGLYKVKPNDRIAVVPIGYADGIIRKNTGRYLYINNNKYYIIGNICMDMLFVKVDNDVKVKDEVILIKNIEDIHRISKYLDTIPYEIICEIGKRVPRKYIN